MRKPEIPVCVVVLAPPLLFLPQRPRKGLVELWGRRRVHDCSGYVCEAGACFSSGQCTSSDLYLADEVQASAQYGPLLRPLHHSTEAAGSRLPPGRES